MFETVTGVDQRRRERSTTIMKAFLGYVVDSGWWILELFIWMLLVSIVCLRFASWAAINVRVFDPSEFPNDLVLNAEVSYSLVVIEAITSFFICARVFYFVRLNPRLNILNKTLQLATKDMFAVLVLSFVILIGFTLAGNSVYGTQVKSMMTIPQCFATLALTFFGDDDFDNWFMAEVAFTVIYYALFVIIAVQLMFNMITSVLGNAYDEAKAGQFNFARLARAAEVDIAWLDRPLSLGDLVPDAVTEVLYWLRRMCRRDSGQRLLLELENRRSFYSRLHNYSLLHEFGTPRESAEAAAQLLLTIHTVMKDIASQHRDLDGYWLSMKQQNHVAVFGIDRVSISPLVRELVNNKHLAGRMLFWCVELPSVALRTSRLSLLSGTLEFHHEWKRSLEKIYDTPDEDKPLGDRLRQLYNQLDEVTTDIVNIAVEKLERVKDASIAETAAQMAESKVDEVKRKGQDLLQRAASAAKK